MAVTVTALVCPSWISDEPQPVVIGYGGSGIAWQRTDHIINSYIIKDILVLLV